MNDLNTIDNIGYRSRILMYVKDENTSEKTETEAKDEKNTETVTGKGITIFIDAE